MSDPDEYSYGTLPLDAPVTRTDFERAIRSLNMSDLNLRDALLNLAARVVALTDELTRRLDGVQPLPAEPNTPAPPPTTTLEAAVDAAHPDSLAMIRANDAALAGRVSLDLGGPKYEQASPDVPCHELIPLCNARCCMLSFALSTEDLEEGVIRWDYGQPYLIRQRASDGRCVHNDPDTRGCTVHAHRPRVCRSYDCRKDPRIWTDFENRIVAPLREGTRNERLQGSMFDLLERARARSEAVLRETRAISDSYADATPRKGPQP
ncbi:MAG TPA: YkgJ family cysteine cluster protein [Kofleriaceae bacterium]|nr:YkgJ family cysteine cluster protein [Kofleriaceae bacterium]